jgi:hypothetical protein
VHRERAGDVRMHALSIHVQRAASSVECGCGGETAGHRRGGEREKERESERASERERERERERAQCGRGENQWVMRCGSKGRSLYLYFREHFLSLENTS